MSKLSWQIQEMVVMPAYNGTFLGYSWEDTTDYGAREPERARIIGHRVGCVRGYQPLPGVWIWRFYINPDGTVPRLMPPGQSIDAWP